uniref:Uncharacterized protein n=1 Tax=Trypanosoma vivax (strain Y486) TaxID=1055687 RepID=G0TVH5_TRYVY|nr:conserved hypothetical protein [Trypanosoma vivax Y486]
MKSAFDIARSHIALPVRSSSNAIRQVLRDWQHYTESVPLQQKSSHVAELCIAVHAMPENSQRCEFTTTKGRLRKVSEQKIQTTHRRSVHTKRIPLRLWTALLPWEVQRGLSMSSLELPKAGVGLSEDSDRMKQQERVSARTLGDCDEDPFGIVSTAPPGGIPPRSHSSQAQLSTDGESDIPGMLFVMTTDAAASGLCFWSGAIQQPIDLAFIAPVEPAATRLPSFKEMRRKQLGSQPVQYDRSRFFPDGELESPTVEFAVQSYSYLDPFPHCEKNLHGQGDGISSREGHKRNGESGDSLLGRQHTVQPEYVDGNDGSIRYVLETRRHLFRDGIASALSEYRLLQHRISGSDGNPFTPTNNPMDVSTEGLQNHENVELIITLVLSDGLIDELREKARLHTNYVTPLEEHLRRLIKAQSGTCLNSSERDNLSGSKEGDCRVRDRGAKMSDHTSNMATAAAITSTNIIRPPVPMDTHGQERITARSPMLVDEMEGQPRVTAPSIIGRHEAPTLGEAQREHKLLVSASALARLSNTTPRMPVIPPLDYELFDLCLRLGLCRHDIIYYQYGRIIRQWKMELLYLRGRRTRDVKANGDNDAELHETDVRRMLRLVRDPSLQVPSEFSACVEAVAKIRQITCSDKEDSE